MQLVLPCSSAVVHVVLGCYTVVELSCYVVRLFSNSVVALLCYWLLYTVGLLDSCVAVLLGC